MVPFHGNENKNGAVARKTPRRDKKMRVFGNTNDSHYKIHKMIK